MLVLGVGVGGQERGRERENLETSIECGLLAFGPKIFFFHSLEFLGLFPAQARI